MEGAEPPKSELSSQDAELLVGLQAHIAKTAPALLDADLGAFESALKSPQTQVSIEQKFRRS